MVQPTSPDTPSVLHYTSGSTGKPKGVLHRNGSLQSQMATTKGGFGLTENDVFWCTADQGWVTGTSYGIIGTWSLRGTQVHYGGGYDAQAWMDLLAAEKITVWYSAPTALRMLMTVINLITSIEAKFNIRFTQKELLRQRTVGDLTADIERKLSEET